MHVRRIVWFGLSTLALASWFSAASTSDVRPPALPLVPLKPVTIDRSMAVLQSEVERLHEHIGPTIAPTRSRDLFRFSVRAPEHRAPSRVAPPVPVALDAPPAVAPQPALKLIGIAEDAQPEGTVRTAIVSGLGDVFLVKPGESIRGQYRIDEVSPDAVQLTDTSTNLQTTLALR